MCKNDDHVHLKQGLSFLKKIQCTVLLVIGNDDRVFEIIQHMKIHKQIFTEKNVDF